MAAQGEMDLNLLADAVLMLYLGVCNFDKVCLKSGWKRSTFRSRLPEGPMLLPCLALPCFTVPYSSNQTNRLDLAETDPFLTSRRHVTLWIAEIQGPPNAWPTQTPTGRYSRYAASPDHD